MGRILRFHPALASFEVQYDAAFYLFASGALRHFGRGYSSVAAFAQPQDSQSVAEAARRARAQKKTTDKPAKVITDDTLVVKKGDVQSATAEEPKMPGSRETPTQPAANAANAPGPQNASDDEKARALRNSASL